MGGGKWPEFVFNEGMNERNKSCMRKNKKWMQKQNIYLNACPKNREELNNFFMEKFCKHIWGKELGIKNKYYVQQFHLTCDLQQKKYIGASLQQKERFVLFN